MKQISIFKNLISNKASKKINQSPKTSISSQTQATLTKNLHQSAAFASQTTTCLTILSYHLASAQARCISFILHASSNGWLEMSIKVHLSLLPLFHGRLSIVSFASRDIRILTSLMEGIISCFRFRSLLRIILSLSLFSLAKLRIMILRNKNRFLSLISTTSTKYEQEEVMIQIFE